MTESPEQAKLARELFAVGFREAMQAYEKGGHTEQHDILEHLDCVVAMLLRNQDPYRIRQMRAVLAEFSVLAWKKDFRSLAEHWRTQEDMLGLLSSTQMPLHQIDVASRPSCLAILEFLAQNPFSTKEEIVRAHERAYAEPHVVECIRDLKNCDLIMDWPTADKGVCFNLLLFPRTLLRTLLPFRKLLNAIAEKHPALL